MACPECGGSHRVKLNTGAWQCTSDVLYNVVPYGMGGNWHAPAGIPLYEPCNYVYSREDDSRAEATRRALAEQEAARQKAETARRAREAKEREERHRERVRRRELWLDRQHPQTDQLPRQSAQEGWYTSQFWSWSKSCPRGSSSWRMSHAPSQWATAE